MPKCNKDCFNCPYPDCIEDELDAKDYDLARKVEREIILPKNKKENEIAAKQRAYREANRDEIAAKQRAYYEANRNRLERGDQIDGTRKYPFRRQGRHLPQRGRQANHSCGLPDPGGRQQGADGGSDT